MKDKKIKEAVEVLERLRNNPQTYGIYNKTAEAFDTAIEVLQSYHLIAGFPDVTAEILRMENKKLGGILTSICKLLKESNVENKYFDQADLINLKGE